MTHAESSEWVKAHRSLIRDAMCIGYNECLTQCGVCAVCGEAVTKNQHLHHLWILRKGDDAEAICGDCVQAHQQGKWNCTTLPPKHSNTETDAGKGVANA